MRFYFEIDRFVLDIAKKYDKEGKTLLDIGAETSPYRHVFKNLTYFSHDIKQDAKNSFDFTGDLNKKLTAKSASMDFILCTQVLEHVQDPANAFREFRRILKPGGMLFLTTNFIYHIHMAPNDYYRFTRYGLEHLGKSSGFQVVHIRPHGGIFHVLSYLIATLPIRLFLENHPHLALAYMALASPLIASINILAKVLDMFDREKRLCMNYEVIFKKSAAA